MAKNKLTDLNNHLFAQIERLGDEELTTEQLKVEVERSKAMIGISKGIIENAKITLEATKFSYTTLSGGQKLPEQFKLEE